MDTKQVHCNWWLELGQKLNIWKEILGENNPEIIISLQSKMIKDSKLFNVFDITSFLVNRNLSYGKKRRIR